MAVGQPPRRYRPTLVGEGALRRTNDETSAAWAFIWVLFAFKMATVFMIYWAARDYEAAVLLTATTWFWLGIPAFACAAPLAFRYRLVRVRARRERLRRAEWLLEADTAPVRRRTGARWRSRFRWGR